MESNEHLGNQYNSIAYENNLPRQDDIKQSLETFSNEFNLRLNEFNHKKWTQWCL